MTGTRDAEKRSEDGLRDKIGVRGYVGGRLLIGRRAAVDVGAGGVAALPFAVAVHPPPQQ